MSAMDADGDDDDAAQPPRRSRSGIATKVGPAQNQIKGLLLAGIGLQQRLVEEADVGAGGGRLRAAGMMMVSLTMLSSHMPQAYTHTINQDPLLLGISPPLSLPLASSTFLIRIVPPNSNVALDAKGHGSPRPLMRGQDDRDLMSTSNQGTIEGEDVRARRRRRTIVIDEEDA